MAHETHDDAQHLEKRSVVSMRSSFWFVIILVGLFIAALNFINVVSNNDSEGNTASEGKRATEAPREATATQTLAGENGEGKSADTAVSRTAAYTDSTHQEKH